MRLKQRVADFRVRELLSPGYLRETGSFLVYRVTKRKLTSPEAADILAEAAGVPVGEVGLAGLKDRQAVTTQHMSVPGGRPVSLQMPGLRIELAGRADRPLASGDSAGNAFEITARALVHAEVHALRGELESVRQDGVPNYFDDQRFGNLRHGQGWIARELALGRHSDALCALLASPSPHDSPELRREKRALVAAWGDFDACHAVARRMRRHHSIFEHLREHPGDFAGAFRYVSASVRLIHLYAWQSHLWNRALAELVRELVPLERRVTVAGDEGPLVCWSGAPPPALSEEISLRLPGEGLADVTDPAHRSLLERALRADGLEPGEFRIAGVPGFQLKGEDRAVAVVPRHLRVRPAKPDALNPGLGELVLRFELPRGSYATLVVKRLFGADLGHAGAPRPERQRESGRGPRAERDRSGRGSGERSAPRGRDPGREHRPDAGADRSRGTRGGGGGGRGDRRQGEREPDDGRRDGRGGRRSDRGRGGER